MMVWRGIFAGLMLSVIALSAHSGPHERVVQAPAGAAQVAAR
ncbi:MAG TPA: hypothetical protein VFA75_15910 [Nevskia sp.]|nr:hypothetical protein [Nevskia sp.]